MDEYGIELRKLIKFFEEVFAHQQAGVELLDSLADGWTDDDYLKAVEKHRQIAAERFRLFYAAIDDPAAFAQAARDFLDTNQTKKRPN